MRAHAGADIVRARGVVKRFGSTAALRGVDLDVPRGAIVVLTGANGAGKTTLLRIVATSLLPDEGVVTVDGADVQREAARVRRAIGVALVNERGLYWRLTGNDNLIFFGRLAGLSRVDARTRASQLLEQVGLASLARSRVSGYSAGQRQRLILARSLVSDPALLLLDEPMRGLDGDGVSAMRALFRARADAGGTVLIAAPTLDGIDGLGDDVIELRDGAVVGRPRLAAGAER